MPRVGRTLKLIHFLPNAMGKSATHQIWPPRAPSNLEASLQVRKLTVRHFRKHFHCIYLKLHLLVPAWLFVPFIGVYTLQTLEVINIWLLDILQTNQLLQLFSLSLFSFFLMQPLVHFSPFDVEVSRTVQGLLHTVSSEANSFSLCYNICDLIHI